MLQLGELRELLTVLVAEVRDLYSGKVQTEEIVGKKLVLIKDLRKEFWELLALLFHQ